MLEWRRKRRSRATRGQVYRCTLWVCFDRLWVRARGRERYSEGWGGGIKDVGMGDVRSRQSMWRISSSIAWLFCHALFCWSGTVWRCFPPGGRLKGAKTGKKKMWIDVGWVIRFRRGRNHKPWVYCQQAGGKFLSSVTDKGAPTFGVCTHVLLLHHHLEMRVQSDPWQIQTQGQIQTAC